MRHNPAVLWLASGPTLPARWHNKGRDSQATRRPPQSQRGASVPLLLCLISSDELQGWTRGENGTSLARSLNRQAGRLCRLRRAGSRPPRGTAWGELVGNGVHPPLVHVALRARSLEVAEVTVKPSVSGTVGAWLFAVDGESVGLPSQGRPVYRRLAPLLLQLRKPEPDFCDRARVVATPLELREERGGVGEDRSLLVSLRRHACDVGGHNGADNPARSHRAGADRATEDGHRIHSSLSQPACPSNSGFARWVPTPPEGTDNRLGGPLEAILEPTRGLARKSHTSPPLSVCLSESPRTQLKLSGASQSRRDGSSTPTPPHQPMVGVGVQGLRSETFPKPGASTRRPTASQNLPSTPPAVVALCGACFSERFFRGRAHHPLLAIVEVGQQSDPYCKRDLERSSNRTHQPRPTSLSASVCLSLSLSLSLSLAVLCASSSYSAGSGLAKSLTREHNDFAPPARQPTESLSVQRKC